MATPPPPPPPPPTVVNEEGIHVCTYLLYMITLRTGVLALLIIQWRTRQECLVLAVCRVRPKRYELKTNSGRTQSTQEHNHHRNHCSPVTNPNSNYPATKQASRVCVRSSIPLGAPSLWNLIASGLAMNDSAADTQDKRPSRRTDIRTYCLM